MENIKVEIVADSINLQGDRLTSMVLTYPRMIHAELLTHRAFSRNASSSRAVPVKKMIESVRNNTFCPMEFQKAHKGMQGSEYFVGSDKQECVNLWLESAELALEQAEKMDKKGISKQIINRILEPYQYYTVLITGSKEGWENFFSLRSPEYHLENVPTVNEDLSLNPKTITLIGKSKKKLLKEINQIDNDSYNGFKSIINNYSDLDWLKLNKGQAEIHIMDLAEKIYDEYQNSVPLQLKENQWHIPFEDKLSGNNLSLEEMIKCSVAMAARTSYTVVGDEKKIDYQKMVDLHDRLLSQDPPHSSPMEHCCICVTDEDYNKSFKGEEKGWFRNYKGFKSYRQIIEESK